MNDAANKMARQLRQAYAGGPIAPLRESLEPGDGSGAYAVQSINTAFWISQGRKPVGHKVGLTAKAVQDQFGVDQPDYGILFDDMAVPDGGTLDAGRLIQPRAEAEVALILAQDVLDPDTEARDIEAAAAYAIAAIEIVDSRIANWEISFADTVADNGSSAYFVLGQERRPLADLDLYTCGMVLELNGEIASVGAGAACLGHPLNAAAWLARELVARGTPLRAGQVILTGALGPMVPVVPGDEVVARIGGVGTTRFTMAGARR